MKPDLSLFYVPCASFEEARGIGQSLLDDGLIACANIIPSMTSLYVWEGKREEATEATSVR